ncbi:MAG: hypothetical protein ACFFD2_05460 [Promethearchaeota archaeon]
MKSSSFNKLRKLIIGFTFNIEKKPINNESTDKYAEFDSPDTIKHIKEALESAGHFVIPIEAIKDNIDMLLNTQLDIIFNIAEGLQNSENRESVFPAIFEYLGIPYVGSDPLCLAITLDKPTAKKI